MTTLSMSTRTLLCRACRVWDKRLVSCSRGNSSEDTGIVSESIEKRGKSSRATMVDVAKAAGVSLEPFRV